jgi:hypothetical protein
MRHAHAGVSGDDVDVVVVHGIAADEGQSIDGLHHLTAPNELDAAHFWGSAREPTPQDDHGAQGHPSLGPVLWSSPPTMSSS